MKMKQVYESNPALGDPMSIQGQLTENGHRLDKLRSELKKFQVHTTNVCNMYQEPRIIPAGYIRSSRFYGPDIEF